MKIMTYSISSVLIG